VEGVDEGGGTSQRRTRLRGASAAKAHLTLALGVGLCAVAFWFEIGRALGGNALSWAYVFEWPLFAVFAVYMWWKVLHPEDAQRPATKKSRKELAPEFNGMLAAWEEHQRDLAAAREREEAASDVETP
jgi:hypothetical protein